MSIRGFGARFGLSWKLALVSAAVVFLSGPPPSFSHAERPQAFLSAAPDKTKKSKEAKKKKRSKSEKKKAKEDRRLVRDRLKEHLDASSFKFLDGGQVEAVYRFQTEKTGEDAFKPEISSGVQAPLRWSVPREYPRGLRIAKRGYMLLDCVFEDQLMAEIRFSNNRNYTPASVVAVSYFNAAGDGIGSNFGSECAVFTRKGRIAKKAGKKRGLNYRAEANFRLEVAEGTFTASRRGKRKSSLAYDAKKFSSGRVGMRWGGDASGTVLEFRVRGKVDIEKTAKILRAQSKR